MKPVDQEAQRLVTRRTLMLGGGQLVLFGALASRLYYLQVVEADKYRLLSRDNQFNLELLPPIRGRILDRNGLALADNQDKFRVELVSEQTGDVMSVLTKLRSIITISDYDVRRVLREVKRKRGFVPVTVVENLGRAEISRVAANTPYLPGVKIEVGHGRYYPFAAQAVHVTGYVAAVSESELTGDPVLELPDFRIGKSGIEKRLDLAMRGTAGQRQVEVNAIGRIIRKLPGQPGQPGADTTLTLDMRLQRLAHRRLEQGTATWVPADDPRALKAMEAASPMVRRHLAGRDEIPINAKGRAKPPESGGVVVMDIHTGAILALVSAPGFDPNKFSGGLSVNDWEELLSNPRAPLTNKAIAGQYSPGSTFKMVVCLAALEAGVASAGTRMFCKGHIDVGDSRFHCWQKHGHGALDMIGAIERSCDVYLYELAKKVGIDRINAMAQRFGLGALTDIDLGGERRGLMPSREWKLATQGTRWQVGETLNTGIGQGFVLTTPLQLATMTARLANGGLAVKPHLVTPAETTPDDPAEVPGLAIAPAHLAVIAKGMAAVTTGPLGTARRAAIGRDNWEMAGKTGTVQVKRITLAERQAGILRNEDRPWRDRDHSLFVGFAPIDEPRYAAAVVVEHGGSGSSMAAPIARDILLGALQLDPLSHTTAGRAAPDQPDKA
ncbi:MAG: penicillin-binding protein 2 [Pseudomonadota bacterium]|nr:penicillin-binding protein 2 [Pseudomonadota bacterium]